MEFQKKDTFRGKNIIVTGATGGIGSALIKELLESGANVLALIRDQLKLPAYLNDYMKTGNFNYEIIDLSSGMKITDAFKSSMIKLFGKLDILILCHGQFVFGNITDIGIKEFDSIININVRANFHLLSLAVPFLKITKGNVVMMSSLESKIVEKGEFLQSLTKSMVNSLIQNAALELASFGIRINGVAPAFVNTNLRIGENLQSKDNADYLKQMGGYSLLGNKVVDPKDIVDCIMFLAREDAGFVTGEIVVVDNGFELNHDLSFKQND